MSERGEAGAVDSCKLSLKNLSPIVQKDVDER